MDELHLVLLTKVAASALLGLQVGFVVHCLHLAMLPGRMLAFWGRWLHRLLLHPWVVVRALAHGLGGCRLCQAWWWGVLAALLAGLPLWCCPLCAATAAVAANGRLWAGPQGQNTTELGNTPAE